MPVDRGLYDVLKIEPDADDSQIRKAYLLQAMKHHPDKNPNDKQAEEMFKKVSDAYQILSDPGKRKQYDEHGTTKQEELVDPITIFKHLFGGDKFVSLIGESLFALALKNADKISPDGQNNDELKTMFDEAISAKSKKNCTDLTEYSEDDPNTSLHKNIKIMHEYLMAKCSPFVKDLCNRSEFEHAIQEEIKSLRNESFAKEIFNAVGYVYKYRAYQVQKKGKLLGIPCALKSVRDIGHSFSTIYGTIKAAHVIKRSQDVENKSPVELESMIMNFFWKATVLEIEMKTRKVLDIYLSGSLSKHELVKRSEAVAIIGELYSQV
ncbi:chaperone dnaJ 10 [Brachionus plicatilis]|uniref:Chaperone dnaJ 10 n=1 Tax=Brachionus plicatilis TaxID=10195 RepID=A0A3M7PNW8_BRAPC|nr:chaperone dnaJ 10 [Brachionus plicatilis]